MHLEKRLKCIRQSSIPLDALPTAPFPRFRVHIDFPNSHTGVDYLGPIYVRNMYGSKKGFIHVILYFISVQVPGR